MSNNVLRYLILIGIFLTPFAPLIVTPSLFFPFITGKAFVFRVLVEIIFVCWLVLAIRDQNYRPKFSWILGAFLAFIAVMGAATIFSENPFKSFWSNYERMEGYITLLHLVAYFLVMGSVLKTQSLWNKLLSTSLGVSAIMAIYSFFQLAGKITINQGGVRVDGTLGNASYLGIYMVFHIFFAGLLMSRFQKRWQRILIGSVALADLIILYFTATRGAMIGLLGGALITFLFLVLRSEGGDNIRKVATGGLVSLLVLVGIFLAIKDTEFVRQNAVLSRFSSLSLSELPTQGRYYVWPMAVKGFAERPILGWGQESFNFVFNKYYDPRMYNQERWFDRAHSTPLDWLIAGGLLGFLSYYAVFAALLFYIFKSSSEYLTKNEKAVVFGLLAAYVFNNLFVFDQIASYILFTIVLAYVHAHAPERPNRFWDKAAMKIRSLGEKIRGPVFESAAVIALVLVLYFLNYLPWQQNKNLLRALVASNAGEAAPIETYTAPLKPGIGFAEALEHVSVAAIGTMQNPDFPPERRDQLFEELDQAFQRHLQKVPDDARYRMFYGMMLSRFGWYGRAVEQFKIARELSPQKQDIAFELANNLLFDNKPAEALVVAREAYEAEPNFAQAKMIYGLTALAAGDQALANKILSDIPESEIVFDDRYLSVLLSLGRYQDIINIARRRVELNPNNANRLTLVAAYLQAERRAEAVSVLREMIAADPSFRERGEYYVSEIEAGRNP